MAPRFTYDAAGHRPHLRHAELSDSRAEANRVSEWMSRPLAVLVFGLTVFVLVPFMLRMFGIS
jgi:hypothetical protein